VRRASDAERERLHETFAKLCRIASPSGSERPCADAVAWELRAIGLEVEEDDAGRSAKADAGNLLTRIPGAGTHAIMLCAHMDTVPPLAPIEPVLVNNGWENANDGILGADNKAAVAALLTLARRLANGDRSPVGVELLFTVSEENGLHGAKAFDTSRLQSSLGYVLDHASPIGEIVVASPTYYRLHAAFRGAAAHAGIRPEAGRSAILAAAKAIAVMPQGRVDDETTANVGTINGGVARNIVADRCFVRLEVRSRDHARALKESQVMLDALAHAANAGECELQTVATQEYRAYKLRRTDPVVHVAWAALESCGFAPSLLATGGGADAHLFNERSIPCANLGNGMELIHTPDERIAVADVEAMVGVTLALVEGARTAV
jgi:tripeptide aminopeptidase